ncbi:MAG: preprotein translocase subunit SecY [Bacilli bacterium]
MTISKSSKKILIMFLFTALFLLVYRLGAQIIMPFISPEALVTEGLGAKMFGFLDVFTGGALSNFSILALGISPYITSSIVIQLLQMDIVPTLKEWSEEGETGKQKLSQLTKYVALGLAFIQSLTLTIGIGTNYQDIYLGNSPFIFVYLAIIATAGTAFSMWLAEKITAKGIGNGSSMLIVTGILASFPQMFMELWTQFITDSGTVGDIIKFFVILLLLVFIIVAIAFMESAQRKIPIQYANRPAAASFRGKSDSNIPIKLNSASVIPVIFASTLMSLPQLIISIGNLNLESGVGYWLHQTFSTTETIGFIVYIILIFVFSFFYAFLQINPEKMSENLQKNNAYIPGVRPGEETASYLARVLFKITMVGATYLSLVAVIPIIISSAFKLTSSAIQIGGTGLIIVVGVAIETYKQLKTQMQEKQYRGFIN